MKKTIGFILTYIFFGLANLAAFENQMIDQKDLPVKKHSELFVVFDDSGSMGGKILNAKNAVVNLLSSTAKSATQDELPLAHIINFNQSNRINNPYPFTDLINYYQNTHLRSGGGTPFASKLDYTKRLIQSRSEVALQQSRELSEVIIYIFTDGEPDGNGGSWIDAMESLLSIEGGSLSVNIQLTILGNAMPTSLYREFDQLTTRNNSNLNFTLTRTDNIEQIEQDASLFAENLLINRIRSRINPHDLHLLFTQIDELGNQKEKLKIKATTIAAGETPKAIKTLLDRAIEEFHNKQGHDHLDTIASGFNKLTDREQAYREFLADLLQLKAEITRLVQRLNNKRDQLDRLEKMIKEMSDDQKEKHVSLIAEANAYINEFSHVDNRDRNLLREVNILITLQEAELAAIEEGYSALIANSLSLINYMKTLDAEKRQQIERMLATKSDIAIDYENRTIIYTGTHFFQGGSGNKGPSYQTDWTVINRGVIVNLGGRGSGGATAVSFINEGVIVQGNNLRTSSGTYTHIINNGRILRLRKDEKRGLHWKRVEENDEVIFFIYDEADGAIYQLSLQFLIDFNRGTRLMGRVINYFESLQYRKALVRGLTEDYRDREKLDGDANDYLTSIYPERLEVLTRARSEWRAMVPKKLIPLMKKILKAETTPEELRDGFILSP